MSYTVSVHLYTCCKCECRGSIKRECMYITHTVAMW